MPTRAKKRESEESLKIKEVGLRTLSGLLYTSVQVATGQGHTLDVQPLCVKPQRPLLPLQAVSLGGRQSV